MNTRMRVSFWCYVLVLVVVALFGAIYLFRPQFMPYHADAVGIPWPEIPRPFQILILALMRTVGGAMLATSVALAAILYVPFRRAETWAKYVLLAGVLVWGIPTLYATLYVRASTPAEPPWIATGTAIATALVAFFLSLPNKQHH